MKVNHQFLNEAFFIPDWEIEYLFLGTFNPEGGEKVNYFYGRESNFTWKILSEIFENDFNPYDTNNFSNFIKQLELKKIACMDIIKSVEFDEKSFDEMRIKGKGYKDSNIINKKVIRKYSTEDINSIIKKNKNVKVFTTWGNGSNLKEWRTELIKLKDFTTLKSPSKAARVPKGLSKFNYVLEDWKSKIIL
jgi:hypothetical protein